MNWAWKWNVIQTQTKEGTRWHALVLCKCKRYFDCMRNEYEMLQRIFANCSLSKSHQTNSSSALLMNPYNTPLYTISLIANSNKSQCHFCNSVKSQPLVFQRHTYHTSIQPSSFFFFFSTSSLPKPLTCTILCFLHHSFQVIYSSDLSLFLIHSSN